MTILLIGGGTGGHITPLLAVAAKLKQLQPGVRLIGVCEKNAKFAHLYESSGDIDEVVQIKAGKFRRYSGMPLHQKLTDVKTMALNTRDAGRTVLGFNEAMRMLKRLKPDVILVKGGFVAVPVGLAAARLKIPFITHDSDSTPGLANRLIARWASLHATGMPAELYDYPQDKTIYTGIPVAEEFKTVTDEMRLSARRTIGLERCSQVVAVVGGSQGAERLNDDVVSVIPRLMAKLEGLGVAHISGAAHEQQVSEAYATALGPEADNRAVVKGFVENLYDYTTAADVVVTRASATALSELALQRLPVILVPGRLAGGHQDKNAAYYAERQAAVTVKYGDADQLYEELSRLLTDDSRRHNLSKHLSELAKPDAARELAEITLKLALKEK